MACSKWEETGLLYSSSELNELEAKQYEEHLDFCPACKQEYETYQRERNLLFTEEVLGEAPSRKTDEEILRVCSSASKQYTHTGFLPLFLKRTVFSVTFFVVGFVVVGYFAMNMENHSGHKKLASEEVIDHSPLDHSVAGATALPQEADSVRVDSISDTNLYYSKTRGNLDMKGVFPVDLKNK